MSKKTYKVLQTISYGKIYRPGDAVEMRDEDAVAFGPDYVREMDVVPGKVEDTDTTSDDTSDDDQTREDELNLMTVKELKAYADSKDIKYTASKKAELVAEILAAETATEGEDDESEA